MKKAAFLFSALSDETRLRILGLLAHRAGRRSGESSGAGELCVCQIESILQMQQSKVSRHLMVLRHAGLVSGRREGVWIHYFLEEPQNDLHACILNCLRTALQKEPQVQADVRRIAECPPIAGKVCEWLWTGKRNGSPSW